MAQVLQLLKWKAKQMILKTTSWSSYKDCNIMWCHVRTSKNHVIRATLENNNRTIIQGEVNETFIATSSPVARKVAR